MIMLVLVMMLMMGVVRMMIGRRGNYYRRLRIVAMNGDDGDNGGDGVVDEGDGGGGEGDDEGCAGRGKETPGMQQL